MNIIYLSHGGGPLPLLGDPGHKHLVESLRETANKIPKPAAILLISAHWEATVATITGQDKPELIYDYSGFPEQAYRIEYPCEGSPELAKRCSSEGSTSTQRMS